MVRCGLEDEREDVALHEGMVFAGWPEVPSLEECTSRESIEAVLRQQFPSDSQYLTRRFHGGVWT